jgi:hypothetical protein
MATGTDKAKYIDFATSIFTVAAILCVFWAGAAWLTKLAR